MRRLFIHQVDVLREPSTVTGRKRDKGLQQALSSVQCLVEPLKSVETQTQMGRVTQADHSLMWGTEDIRANDTVVWGTRRFIVGRVIADVSRPFSSVPPYHSAELREQATS